MDLETFEDSSFDLDSLETGQRLGRRTFLIAGLATGAAATALPNYAAIARKKRVPLARNGTFPMGVASGKPFPKGTVLWTKLGEVTRSKRLTLEVARDPKFKRVVLEKEVKANSATDFTARTQVKGLKPYREYYYRFKTKNTGSPVGKFRTAPPVKSQQPITIAFISCQSYEAGFYNALAAIAKEDVDVVLHLGDYIYESDYYTEGRTRIDSTGAGGDGDVQLLEEYRQKYALYKGDPDLQAMHAAHNFVSVWDDHEVEDNIADGSPSSHAKPGMTNNGNPRRVSLAERKLNGYRAFFDYMPRIRFPGERDRVYDTLRLGRLVDLVITDLRQYRSQQPCKDAQLTPCPQAQNPALTMLGSAQKSWFLQTLHDSPATWKLWANEVMMMGLQTSPGLGVNLDQWDGYAAERREIVDFIANNGISNVVSLVGDIHAFFTGTVDRDGGSAGSKVMAEFVGGSATSKGLPEATGIPAGTMKKALELNDKHISFADVERRGYVLVQVTPSELTCEFKTVQTAVPDGGLAATLAKWSLPSGTVIPQRTA